MHILLVTPGQTIAHFIQRQLSAEMDAKVSIFHSSIEGLQELAHDHYDLVMCSSVMKDLTGIQFYREMQASHIAPDTKFLLMTSDGEKERIQEIQEEKIEHYLVFPTSQEELAQKIELVCNPRTYRTAKR